MRRTTRAAIPFLLAWALGIGAAQAQVVVRMDGPTQSRLGIRTAPLAALDADLSAARAAAAASAAEAARTAALARADATVSRKVAEAAAAQAKGDAAKLTLLRRRVGLEWGPALAEVSDARRGALVAAASAGRAALVRLDRIGAGLGPAPSYARVDLGSHGQARAVVLGPSRAGDPRAVAPGLLALVEGPAAAWIGTGVTLPVVFPAAPGPAGVLIPRDALIRTAGSTFAYVRTDADHFERRPVTGGQPQPDGLFAPAGFRPGEAVVTDGAAKLLAAETTPAKGG